MAGSPVAPAILLALCCAPCAASEAVVRLAGDRHPAVLRTFELPDAMQALAVRPDGLRAAVAVLVDPDPREPRSEIRIHDVSGADPLVLEVPGTVRDLLYLDEPRGLFAIEHHPAKRHEGECFLLRFDPATGKLRRQMRLPPSAREIDYWAAGDSLLVAARNEIRTITFPLLRSGPMYRIPGDNFSVAAVGGSRILVGQWDAVLLVDLSDPQPREGMPLRERAASDAPVVELAAAADGSSVLARLEDERVLTVAFRPLRFVETESEAASPEEASATTTPAPAVVIMAEESVAETAPHPEAAPVETPAETMPAPAVAIVAEQSAPEPAPPAEAAAVEAPAEPTPAPAAAIAAEEPAPDPAPPPEAREPERTTPAASPTVRLRGHIGGAAASLVVAVVVLGPDNLLREAARVRPDGDGNYRVEGLEAGRYAVQLDGGGGTALVVQPPSRSVRIDGKEVAVADFEVLRAL